MTPVTLPLFKTRCLTISMCSQRLVDRQSGSEVRHEGGKSESWARAHGCAGKPKHNTATPPLDTLVSSGSWGKLFGDLSSLRGYKYYRRLAQPIPRGQCLAHLPFLKRKLLKPSAWILVPGPHCVKLRRADGFAHSKVGQGMPIP